MKMQFGIVGLLILGIFTIGCGSKTDEVVDIQEYTGPVLETGPAINYYSDSAVVKIKMEAPRQLDFGNGDQEFPDGLHLEFYEDGKMSSTLRADYCYYTAKDNLYKATGNVVIQRADNDDRLDTEELFWNRKEEEVFTDKYVMIQQGGELTKGVGLRAKQDFSWYEILEVQGFINLDKQEGESENNREDQ